MSGTIHLIDDKDKKNEDKKNKIFFQNTHITILFTIFVPLNFNHI